MSKNTNKLHHMVTEHTKIQHDIAKNVAERVKDYLLEQYHSGGWEGMAWADKADGSPSYLYDTGDLLKEIENCIKEVDIKKVVIGIDTPYAPYLNDGTNKMPARPFFVLSDGLQDAVKKVISYELSMLNFRSL